MKTAHYSKREKEKLLAEVEAVLAEDTAKRSLPRLAGLKTKGTSETSWHRLLSPIACRIQWPTVRDAWAALGVPVPAWIMAKHQGTTRRPSVDDLPPPDRDAAVWGP